MTAESALGRIAQKYIEQLRRGDPLGGAASTTIGETDPFFTYARPAEYGVHSEAVRVPMRDGVALAGQLLRPALPDGSPAPGPFPGILYDFTPYPTLEFSGLATHAFVTRGYLALVMNVRGAGESPGTVVPFGAQEQRDAVDLIHWLAERPFCTGRIGQMGTSYGGALTLLTATHQPEPLAAVIAVQAFSDWYEDTVYRGGIPSAEIRDWQQAFAPDTLEVYPRHPVYDEFWRERSVRARWDRLTVPVLNVGGWLDSYRDAMVANFQGRPERMWLLAGPWEHGMVPGRFEDVAATPYLAWWDHWLLDRPVPLPQARVTSYELPEGGWRQYDTWPPAESVRTTLHPTPSGTLGPAEAGTVSFQANTERVGFESPPLAGDVVLTGGMELVAVVSFTSGDGHLTAVLTDEAPDGRSTRVGEGWLKASHRNGSEYPVAPAPGELVTLRVPLWPIHHRVRAGHRLRLVLASDDYPMVDTVAPAGTVTVHLGEGTTFSYLSIVD